VLTIRFGLFTPSEVGAFAVLYAIAVGVLAHRQMTLRTILEAVETATRDVGMIMLIILMSGMVGYAIILDQVPQTIAETLLERISDPNLLMLAILLILVIAGLFIESTVLVLLLTPIFVPLVKHVGVDPVHFGVLMMIIVTLGSMTPPVGVAMYTVCSLMNCKVEDYVVEAVPFLLAVVLLTAVLVFFPGIVLFIPNAVF